MECYKKYRENPRTEKHLHSSHIPDHAQVGTTYTGI